MTKYDAPGFDHSWSIDEEALNNGWSIDFTVPHTGWSEVAFTPGFGEATFTLRFTNDNGCRKEFYYKVQSSICEEGSTEAEAFEMNVYPNPVKDNLNIKFNKTVEDTKIELYDLLGNVMYTNSIAKVFKLEEVSINFNDMPGNVYYLKITNKYGTTIKKIVLDK